jgi:hypothetical protein
VPEFSTFFELLEQCCCVSAAANLKFKHLEPLPMVYKIQNSKQAHGWLPPKKLIIIYYSSQKSATIQHPKTSQQSPFIYPYF